MAEGEGGAAAMLDDVLDRRLRAHTASETWHLAHPGKLSPVYGSTPRVTIDGEDVLVFDWRNTVRRSAIGLIKETRFTTIPPHVNTAMELNYLYSGSCRYVVDGRQFELTQGDAVLFDTEAVRSVPSKKGENDIVIAITFLQEFFDSVFLASLPGGGILTTFLFESISHRRQHDHAIIVTHEHTGNLPELIRLLTREYLFPDVYTEDMLRSYATLVFMELIRALYYQAQLQDPVSNIDDKTARILDHIEHNYKTCTLGSVAREFGYSTNYLGNLLKAKTGETFSQIRLGQQMSEAAWLLLNTERSIEAIAHKVGITNMSFFYRKFELFYQMTPRAYRKALAGSQASRHALSNAV